MDAASAPGIPFHFRDNVGVTNTLAGLSAYGFADPVNGVTLSLYASQSVNGTITVDMTKLGYPSASSAVTVPVHLPANQFGYVILNSSGSITTSWAGGSDLYEAESATKTVGSPGDSSLGNYSCTTICSNDSQVGYIWKGNKVTFSNVNVAASGVYDLAVSYLNGNAADITGSLTVNSNAPLPVKFTHAASWSSVPVVTIPVYLHSGSANSISFKSDNASYSMNLDKITVQPLMSHSYEAEASPPNVYGNAAVQVHAYDCAPCSGGQLVGNIGHDGLAGADTLTVNNVNVGAAGLYKLNIAYTAGVTDSRNYPVQAGASLALNPSAGTEPVYMFYPGTKGWTNLGNQQVTVSLKAGDNALHFANPTYAVTAPNIDKITVTPINELSYEAESGTLAGTAVAAACSSGPYCSAGSYVNGIGSGSGNTLSFNVSAASTGSYRLTVAYLNSNSNASSKTADLYVNGTLVETDSYLGLGSAQAVGTFTTIVSLNSGSNTIKFQNNSSAGPGIDQITIKPVSGTSIEAEASTNVLTAGSNEMGAGIGFCSYCSLGKQVGYVGLNNSTLILIASVPVTGYYKIKAFYYNGNGVDTKSNLNINGTLAPVMTYAPTANWSTQGNVTSGKVFLNAGANSIQFYNVPGYGQPNYDKFSIE